MNSKKTIFSAVLLLLTLALAAGCVTPPPATPDPIVVEAQVELARTEAALTVVAQLTADAPLTPTATEAPPTETPTEVPPTATVPPLPTVAPTNTIAPTLAYPTWTPTPSAYQCQIVSQNPSTGQRFPKYADLDARWTVKNTGTKTWEKSVTDFYYVSGNDIHKYEDRFDLPKDVAPGKEIDFVVDVSVPGVPGYYTETWVLGMGSETFCTLTYSINVVN